MRNPFTRHSLWGRAISCCGNPPDSAACQFMPRFDPRLPRRPQRLKGLCGFRLAAVGLSSRTAPLGWLARSCGILGEWIFHQPWNPVPRRNGRIDHGCVQRRGGPSRIKCAARDAASKRVENTRLSTTTGYFHAGRHVADASVPSGKGVPNSKQASGTFDSFFGPEQSHSLRDTPPRWGSAEEHPILGEFGTRGPR